VNEADRIEHPALGGGGTPLAAAELNDRQRLGIVLQAAGLLSLGRAAGWRVADDFASAAVDGDGLLRGVRVEPGAAADGALPQLAALTRRLFGGGERIAGRGEARAAARKLVERWAHALAPGGVDAAIVELLETAPFLAEAAFASARDALAGTLVRDGRGIVWRAGRALAAGGDGDLAALVAAARWDAAVRAGREHPQRAAAAPLAFAQALWATGRVEQALFVLEGRREPAAELLRAEALHHLGELGAAREAVRRIERAELSAAERIAAGDVVLRVLATSGELDAARDFAALALRDARGGERRGARWLAALAACDRGDLDAADRHLAEAGEASSANPFERLAVDARLALAQARHQVPAALALARLRLARGRRRMGRARAGRAWNEVGCARIEVGDLRGAERAFGHAARLLRRTDGPLAVTLAGFNLAETRLRRGNLREVETLLAQSIAHNRRAGNARALDEDELLAVRLDLVRGAWESAASRCRRRLDSPDAEPHPSARRRFAVLGARALGWSGQAAAARAWLTVAGDEAATELEREELPFLFALAGDSDRALGAAAGSPLAQALVRGETPAPARWTELAALEPYRRARFVLDAELLLPGAAPGELRADAAAHFHRLGTAAAAAVCERSAAAAWSALARYFERPAGDRAAAAELLAAVGHPEAELVVRAASGERRYAGGGAGRPELDERVVPRGDDEVVLRAAGIDEPLRALSALFARDLPPGEPAPPAAARSSLAGESAALRAAVDRLAKFAASELPVLVLGENGTGKELAAAEIHRLSERRKGPWVPVNCAGLSETLLLSELFGHVRGAFTGADQPRAGVFESGRGGTVFLDEIGDLPLVAQGALLRVLQEREIRRLGESLPRKVDVRIVAATNRDLEAMVEQGRFRQDLFFRLKVATVVLPPLRERGDDVLRLADRFLDEIRSRGRVADLRLSPDARRALAAHAWPGNVRELRNTLEAAAALAEGGVVTPEHLDLQLAAAPNGDGDYHRQVEEFRLRLVRRALESADGSLAGAARQLGVTRQFLSQVVRKHGLRVTR
jgi:transcriptional regulator with AAA-type ATPase domain